MRSYIPIARGTFMVGMVYRFGFLFTILGNIVYLGVAYYLWRSIYRYSDVIRGLTFNETFLYVGLGSAIFILLKTYADWYLHYEIREGIIAIYLTKPIDLQLYMLFANLGSLLMNLMAITLPTAIMLGFVFRVSIPFGVGLFLFPLSLLLAFLISFSIDYFVGLMGFYSESVWGLSMTKEIIISVFSGALIPIQFFPEAMQKVLLWLPFQAIFHTPIMMLTRPNQGLDVFLPMLAVQAAWAFVLYLAARLFYDQAVKVLRVAGG
ncbi:MAG TPA: ABC-2 family transporter protein [Anaerolineales bacterium]|nr:ABC-2 family transporter protein [Anaerolineales bacterium]